MTPDKVDLPVKAVSISAGDSHTAALTRDGHVFIWGTFRVSQQLNSLGRYSTLINSWWFNLLCFRKAWSSIPNLGATAACRSLYRVSQKSNSIKTFAYISACSHPLQTKIYQVVCHSYPYLGANFSPLTLIFIRTATLLITLTPEF